VNHGEDERADPKQLHLEQEHRDRPYAAARGCKTRIALDADRRTLDQHVAHIHGIAEREKTDRDQKIGRARGWQE